MRRPAPCVPILCLLVSACGAAPAAKAPADETLSRLGHAGDTAYNLEDAGQAVDQYRKALGRARERDDAAAIADAGFNLATAQLRADRLGDALRTARELRAELARRGLADRGFDLITATALFRSGDLSGADRAAAALTQGRAPLADSAWFLRGLIADTRGDHAGLQRAAAALTPAADAADRMELRARVAHGPALALRAADLRRDALDYRGLSRVLALAAAYSPDPAASADLYLRAARGAAARTDVAQARQWLIQARTRAPTPQLRGEAERALAGLPH